MERLRQRFDVLAERDSREKAQANTRRQLREMVAAGASHGELRLLQDMIRAQRRALKKLNS